MNFHPITHAAAWLRSANAAPRTRKWSRYPSGAEPYHRGWTGRSLAIEAALTTGLDGSTGALVSLWKATDVGAGRGSGVSGAFIPEWQNSYSQK